MSSIVRANISVDDRQFIGDLHEVIDGEPEDIPGPEDSNILPPLGAGIYVTDYIEGYQYTNEFDITDALQKAINVAWAIHARRYENAKPNVNEPNIDGRPKGYWSKSGDSKVPSIVIPEGTFRVTRDIYIPGNFAIVGEDGWNSCIKLMDGARIHVLGTFTAPFGLFQPLGGTIKDIKIVPDGSKRDYPTLNLYGNLSNWDLDHVHIMNSGNKESACVWHHSNQGLETPLGKTDDTPGSSVHLKECRFRNCQLEYGKVGIFTRAGLDCVYSENMLVYMEHGMHISNGKQSRISNNTIYRGGYPVATVGISAPTTTARTRAGKEYQPVIHISGNLVNDYDLGALCNFEPSRLIGYINTFEECRGGNDFASISQRGVWNAPSNEGIFVKGKNMWNFGLNIDPFKGNSR